jgi:adenylate cyclase
MSLTVMIMLLLVGITALVLPRCGTRYWTDIAKGIGLTIGLIIAFLVASFLSFDNGYVLNILYPLLIVPIIYTTNIIFVIITEQLDKRFVKELFGRYVSPTVAREIVSRADAGKLELAGEEREVTVLFADIRNFTQISEQMSPQEIVEMLNTYLSVAVDTIVDNDGMINKFAGDNIMAVWNAPQAHAEHAKLAVKAAWEVQQKITAMQKDDSNLPVVQFGIGINTGKALAGNIGSTGRSEYTVIGDTVNVASRICSGTPRNEVWIGADTYELAKAFIEADELEAQKYKGKTTLVSVYRVTGLRSTISQEDK